MANFYGGLGRYVVYRKYSEQDCGYESWLDTSTTYFEIDGVTTSEKRAKQRIEELDAAGLKGARYENVISLDEPAPEVKS